MFYGVGFGKSVFDLFSILDHLDHPGFEKHSCRGDCVLPRHWRILVTFHSYEMKPSFALGWQGGSTRFKHIADRPRGSCMITRRQVFTVIGVVEKGSLVI